MEDLLIFNPKIKLNNPYFETNDEDEISDKNMVNAFFSLGIDLVVSLKTSEYGLVSDKARVEGVVH